MINVIFDSIKSLAIDNGMPVILVVPPGKINKIVMEMISHFSGVDIDVLKKPKNMPDDGWKKVTKAIDMLMKGHIYISDDKPREKKGILGIHVSGKKISIEPKAIFFHPDLRLKKKK